MSSNPLPPRVIEAGRIAELMAHQWIADHCWITNKSVEFVRLKPNTAQLKLQAVINAQQRAGKPVRVLILKARQQGITTWGAACQYFWCNKKANQNALISAHDDDASTDIFRKIKMYQEADPESRPEQYSTRKEITYKSPWRSSMLVKTAGKENLGRGSTIHCFHGSEVAFWDNAKATLLSVLQCVPKGKDTSVLLESTANGLGGEFYDRWQAAVKGNSNYYPLFLAWHNFPEYVLPAPKGMAITEEERLERELYGLNDGQIMWRRMTIADECGGDLDMFHQEYPSCADEAFLVSGRPVFHAGRLSQMEKDAIPPRFVGRMVGGSFVEELRGPVRIWQKPVEDQVYVLGGDPSQGLKPDEADDPDASSAHVGNVNGKCVVAKLHGQLDTDEFSDQMDQLGRWYGTALLGFEVNNTMGGAVRELLKASGYPNLYMRKRYKKHGDDYSQEIGWMTDKVTREILVNDLIQAIRDGWLDVPCGRTIHELRVFVRDKNGKPVAQPGEHDDDVMSLGITLQMMIQAAGCQMVGDYVATVSDAFVVKPDRDGSYADNLAYNDAKDYMEDMEEGDDDDGWN